MKKLRYTAKARSKYERLTGSQRQFVDQGLDQLKQDNLTSQKLVNEDLGLTIIYGRSGNEIEIKDILYDDYRKTGNYRDAQQRMNDWNN